MEACSFHPDHAAIEHCEVCHRPLCDLCLWYAEDGRRLCATHARAIESTGTQVFSPETYDDAVQPRTVIPTMVGGEGLPQHRVPYRGNSHDVTALVSAVVGITTLASCFGFMYCLPFVSGILGFVALSNAKSALDPTRTRNLGILGLVTSAVGLFPMLMAFGYFALIFVLFIISSAAGNVNFGP